MATAVTVDRDPERGVGTGIRDLCALGLDAIEFRPDDMVEPGDVILAKTTGNPVSRLIARLDGWWTHTAISLGDGRVAHAHTPGITIDSFESFADHYPSGIGVARPNLAPEARHAAAAYAEQIATDRDSEYDAVDLGVAYSLLHRAKRQPGVDELLMLDVDDGLESLRSLADGEESPPPPDFSATCSGFVYECYRHGAGRRLEIEPAPGIRVHNHHLVVPDRDDLLDELYGTSGEELIGLGAKLAEFRALLGITVHGVRSARRAIARAEPVPIEQGVTPMDMWMSPSHGQRWLVAGRAELRSALAGCLEESNTENTENRENREKGTERVRRTIVDMVEPARTARTARRAPNHESRTTSTAPRAPDHEGTEP